MVAQKGKDLLLKIDLDGSGNFQTLAGLRASRISFASEPVDVTSLESSGRWRELLSGAGARSASITGSGVFRNETTDRRAREIFFASDTPVFQVIIPGYGTIEGSFHISSLDYSGSHDGEAVYDLSLASAGPLSFTELA